MWCEIQDRHAWNSWVLGFPNSDLRQGYEWGEVRASQGWKPRRLAIFQADTCVAAVSILVKRVPFCGWSILYAPGGPLLHDATDDAVWNELLAAIGCIAEETRAAFLRTDPKISDRIQALRAAMITRRFQHLSDDWTIWNNPRIVMTMDAREPEAVLKRNVRKRYREYIAAASKRDLTVRRAVCVEEARIFQASLVVTGRRKQLPVRGHAYFERLWHEYLQPGQGVLLLAEHQNTPVGGLLGVKFGREAYMLYVTRWECPEGVRAYQGPLLYWEFIRWAKARGCDTVNWGGIGTRFPPQEDDPGFGIYRFKLGFNSSVEYLSGYYDLIFSRSWYDTFRFFECWGSAIAWNIRAHLNGRCMRLRMTIRSAVNKVRQLWISVRQRGLCTTLYWAAFGYLKPNRFVLLANDLSRADHPPMPQAGVRLERWTAVAVRDYRQHRRHLSTEFFQDEIDGVETCAVALVHGELAGLIWIYVPGDASRLFRLQQGEAELNHGHVLPTFRGLGLFKDLLALACHEVKRQGYHTVYAGVHAANGPSLRAFRRVGFHDIGSVRHFMFFRSKARVADAKCCYR